MPPLEAYGTQEWEAFFLENWQPAVNLALGDSWRKQFGSEAVALLTCVLALAQNSDDIAASKEPFTDFTENAPIISSDAWSHLKAPASLLPAEAPPSAPPPESPPLRPRTKVKLKARAVRSPTTRLLSATPGAPAAEPSAINTLHVPLASPGSPARPDPQPHLPDSRAAGPADVEAPATPRVPALSAETAQSALELLTRSHGPKRDFGEMVSRRGNVLMDFMLAAEQALELLDDMCRTAAELEPDLGSDDEYSDTLSSITDCSEYYPYRRDDESCAGSALLVARDGGDDEGESDRPADGGGKRPTESANSAEGTAALDQQQDVSARAVASAGELLSWLSINDPGGAPSVAAAEGAGKGQNVQRHATQLPEPLNRQLKHVRLGACSLINVVSTLLKAIKAFHAQSGVVIPPNESADRSFSALTMWLQEAKAAAQMLGSVTRGLPTLAHAGVPAVPPPTVGPDRPACQLVLSAAAAALAAPPAAQPHAALANWVQVRRALQPRLADVQHEARSIIRRVVNVVDSRGRMPLHSAAASGRVDIVELLLMLGASPLMRSPRRDGSFVPWQLGMLELVPTTPELTRCLSMFTPRPAAWQRVPERTALAWQAPATADGGAAVPEDAPLADGADAGRSRLQVSWPQWVNHRGAAIGAGAPGVECPVARCYGLGAASIESAVAHATGVVSPALDCAIREFDELLVHRAAHGPSGPQIAVLKAHLAGHASALVPRRSAGCLPFPDGLDGGTPLHAAAYNSQVQVVEHILAVVRSQENIPGLSSLRDLAAEAMVNQMLLAQDDYGRTPLHIAAGNGCVAIVSLLVRTIECAVDGLDKQGRTALHHAAAVGARDCIDLLWPKMQNICYADHAGWTPLHHAACSSDLEAVDALVIAGAHLHLMDRKGFTPAHLAAQAGQWDILERLLDAGFDVDSRAGIAGSVQSWSSTPLSASAMAPTDLLLLGATCLHIAAMRGDVELIYCLLEHSPAASIEVPTKSGCTPLALAVMLGKGDAVRALLRSGARADYTNDDGERILHHAVYGADEDVFDLLLDVGAIKFDGSQQLSNSLRNPFHFSDHAGLPLLQRLYAAGFSVTQLDRSQNLPLQMAAAAGNSVAVEFMLDKLAEAEGQADTSAAQVPAAVSAAQQEGSVGDDQASADANAHLQFGADSERVAAMTDQLSPPTVAAALRHSNASGQTLLACAVTARDEVTVRALVRRGADVRSLDANGRCCLHWALQASSTHLVASKQRPVGAVMPILLESIRAADAAATDAALPGGVLRALVNTRERVGWTPLHIACCDGDVAMVRKLIDLGADVSVPATNGSTPLHVAARNHHRDVVLLLIASRALVTGTDQVGATPLHVVVEHLPGAQLCAYLLQALVCQRRGRPVPALASDLSLDTVVKEAAEGDMAALSAQDIAGWQPLHCAVHSGCRETVQLLLMCGARAHDERRARNDGSPRCLSALHLACYCGHEQLVWLLIQAGYSPNAVGAHGRTTLHYAALGPLQHTEPWLFSIQPLDPTRVVPPCSIRKTKFIKEVEAANSAFFMCVMACVQSGASLMVRDAFGALPLHYAAAAGNHELVDYMLNMIDHSGGLEDHNGRTLLHYACASGWAEMLQPISRWLQANPTVRDAKDSSDRIPLHYAAQTGCLEMLKVLLEGQHNQMQAVHGQDVDGFTPVLLAAQHGHFDAVSYLLMFCVPVPPMPPPAAEGGPAAEPAPPEQKHALLLAAEQGLPVVLAWLLAFSTSQVNCCDSAGFTPLHYACSTNNETLVQLLNAAGANASRAAKDATTPLHSLALTGPKASTKIAQWLLAAGAPVFGRTASGCTPLHLAATSGAASLVPLFSSVGCPVNAINKDGHTALMLAATNKHVECAQALLAARADPNVQVQTLAISTALQIAAHNGCVELVRHLLDAQTELDAQSHSGCSALHHATNAGHAAVAHALLGAGADPDIQNINGSTALHMAATKGHDELIEALVKASADLHIKNGKGWTAIQCAATAGHLQVCVQLVCAGANYKEKGDVDVVKSITRKTTHKATYVQGRLDVAAKLALRQRKQSTSAQKVQTAGVANQVEADDMMQKLIQEEEREKQQALQKVEKRKAKKNKKKQRDREEKGMSSAPHATPTGSASRSDADDCAATPPSGPVTPDDAPVGVGEGDADAESELLEDNFQLVMRKAQVLAAGEAAVATPKPSRRRNRKRSGAAAAAAAVPGATAAGGGGTAAAAAAAAVAAAAAPLSPLRSEPTSGAAAAPAARSAVPTAPSTPNPDASPQPASAALRVNRSPSAAPSVRTSPQSQPLLAAEQRASAPKPRTRAQLQPATPTVPRPTQPPAIQTPAAPLTPSSSTSAPVRRGPPAPAPQSRQPAAVVFSPDAFPALGAAAPSQKAAKKPAAAAHAPPTSHAPAPTPAPAAAPPHHQAATSAAGVRPAPPQQPTAGGAAAFASHNFDAVEGGHAIGPPLDSTPHTAPFGNYYNPLLNRSAHAAPSTPPLAPPASGASDIWSFSRVNMGNVDWSYNGTALMSTAASSGPSLCPPPARASGAPRFEPLLGSAPLPTGGLSQGPLPGAFGAEYSRVPLQPQVRLEDLSPADRDAARAQLLICPLTRDLLHDPVQADDGVVYERQALYDWVAKHGYVSPVLNKPMTRVLHDATTVRRMVRAFIDRTRLHTQSPFGFSVPY